MTSDGASFRLGGELDEAAWTALARLSASGALTDGRVSVISLDAIAGQLGERWPMRRNLVYEHIERDLAKSVGAAGFYLRTSDNGYLVAQPGRSSIEGQTICFASLRRTLQHFLGEALVCDIHVHKVTRLEAEGVFGERLDVLSVEEKAAACDVEPAEPGGARGPDTGAPGQWSPFVASNGKRVRVSCSLEPVFQLKTSTRIGYRLARRVLALPTDTPIAAEELRRLATADIERIDFATIERGLDRLRSDSGDKDPSLILPVSYATLSSGRGRAVLIDLLRTAQQRVKLGLICEVCDIEGVPAGALLSAISLIRPFSLYVFGRLNEAPKLHQQGLKGVGLSGLSMECPSSVLGDAEFVGWARSTRAAARPVGKSAILYRLPSLRHAAIASLMGATHGTLRTAA